MKTDYSDNRQKQHYRRWIANRICERLKCKPKDATVVWLRGPNHFEEEILLSRGFRRENLIAVEREPEHVKAIREQGGLCIHGEFFDAIRALHSNDHRIDVVYGDFVCGLDFKVLLNIIETAGLRVKKGCVMAFNFLRGRDSSTNEIRAGSGFWPSMPSKHRGWACFAYLADAFLGMSIRTEKGKSFSELPPSEQAEIIHAVRLFTARVGPSLHLYRSGTQWFDSVVFNNFYEIIAPPTKEELATLPVPPLSTSRSAAAIMAVRTMRRQAA